MGRILRPEEWRSRLVARGVFYYGIRNCNKQEIVAILTVTAQGSPCSPEAIRDLIAQSLDADKAQNINTIDLRGQTDIADYIIVASGTSSRQVGALAQKIQERLKARGLREARIEGSDQCNWVIVDAGDVIVHIFKPEVREFYNIEKMWHDPEAAEQAATRKKPRSRPH